MTGKPFIPGGDAEKYYDIVVEILSGDISRYYGRFKLYLYVLVKYYELINIFVSSTNYWYFIILNIFMCSSMAPLLYKISKGFFSHEVAISASCLTISYPLIIQVATNTWREAFVYSPFLLSIYFSLNPTKRNLIFFFLTLLFIANIRMEVSIIAMIFFLSYNFIFNKGGVVKNNQVFIVLFLLMAVYYAYNGGLFEYLKYKNSSSLAYQMDAYKELSDSQSDDGSIANFLRNFGVFGKILLVFYALLVPVPPPFFADNKMFFHSIIIAVGATCWYFILPASLKQLKYYINNKNSKISVFSKSFGVILLITITIIALTSLGSARHKLYLYPILFLFYFDLNQNKGVIFKYRFYSVIFLMLVLLTGAYLLLKSL